MTDMLMHILEGADAAQLCRADVVRVTESGAVLVDLAREDAKRVRCDLLVTTDAAPPLLAPGDQVLVWAPPRASRGVVLGRIGPSRAAPSAPVDVPDTLTIEAKQTLTLRVGDGSITIREDGKVLIKGKDLVSHAQRTNRIRGGSVAIN